MEWVGHAKIKFTHSPTPLILNNNDGTTTDLLKICKESTPPCQLNPLLFNGHAQTMMTAVKNDGPPVFYKRKIFDAEDSTYEGTFAVDFVTKPNTDVDDSLPVRTTHFSEEAFNGIASLDTRPMLVTMHGLSGGSYEIYLYLAMLRTNLQTDTPDTPTTILYKLHLSSDPFIITRSAARSSYS
jgi:predicted alpha/beta-fold hydrolase